MIAQTGGPATAVRAHEEIFAYWASLRSAGRLPGRADIHPEITGHTVDEIYSTAAADYWRAELDKVVDDRRPGVGVHNFAWRGAGHLSILWLRLPLAGDGEGVDMILGYDAVLGVHGNRLSSGIRAA
jgi:hypothetical protein